MVNLQEEELIYFNKTKEYFKGVMADYSIENYRSAIVMLYAVAICDLLFKLQELRDMYDDTIAKKILEDIEENRSSLNNVSKSKWEKELVDRIYKETELLDLQSYTDLNHLYDHRNFSAHPALNENYELITPSKETTIAHIKNVLINILIKPPVFAKNVVNMMTEDIASKREVYKNEIPEFKKYIKTKYISRMSEPMKIKAFRAFWKFCFCLPENEDCKVNLTLNRRVLEVLYEDSVSILENMKKDVFYSNIPVDEEICKNLCVMLSRYPDIYSVLSDDTKMQIKKEISKDPVVKMISWFTSINKKEHLKKLKEEAFFGDIDKAAFTYISNAYETEGLQRMWHDYCIENFSKSVSFDNANNKYAIYISPILDMLTRDQFIALIAAINGNDQIYRRNAAEYNNNEIVRKAKELLGEDFNYEAYSNFKFTEKILQDFDDDEFQLPWEEELPFS